jgi:cell division transport system permease protein
LPSSFFLAEAFRSIRANAAVSVAATVTVLIAVFILGAFIPSFLYVQSSVDSQKSKIDVQVYLDDAANNQQVNAIKQRIEDLRGSGEVKSYTFVSKDEAIAEFRKRLDDPSILEYLPDNPLPRSFNLKLVDPSRAADVVAGLKGAPGLDIDLGDKSNPGIRYGRETAEKLLSVARFIQWAGLGLILILLVAAVLLIGNTIRLSIFARRREVEVMKLVGATNWFIRWPFVIEGVICGLVGALASVALLWAIKLSVVDQFVRDADPALTRDEATTIGFTWLCIILVVSGAAVGALGSGITLRRFLKV